MQISPFLEIFVGLFLLSGALVGWFTRIPVILFAAAIAVIAFSGFAYLESLNPPAAPRLSEEDVYVSVFIAGLAAIPALLSAGLGRFLKRRKSS